MKKTILSVLAAAVVCSFTFSPVAAAASAEPAPSANDWDLTRATVEYTDDGILLSQTEAGVPDNHAIAIYEIPFENLDSFEIKFRIDMADYVASGRQANDVWTAVNVMGTPTFFNWRNSETYGWAKDTPGLVTRFMSYDGDLRLVTDVYHDDYKTAGDDQSSQVVDTWTLLQKSAGAMLSEDVTLKLQWETKGASAFYSMYINGEKVSTSDELAFIDRSVLFPDNKIYLTVVMNTQEKRGSSSNDNPLSTVLIKEINGVSYTSNGSSGGEGGSSAKDDKKEGCGSFVGVGAVCAAAFVIVAGGLALTKKR